MAIIHGLYSDADCKTMAKSGSWGVAALTGSIADLANWNKHENYLMQNTKPIYTKTGVRSDSGVTLGGINRWFSMTFSAEYPSPSNWLTHDTIQNGSNQIEGNAFFISPNWAGDSLYSGYDTYSAVLRIWSDNEYYTTGYNYNNITVRFLWYGQKPETNRTQWRYYDSNNYFRVDIGLSRPPQSQYTNIGFYRVTIGNNSFVMVAVGYNDAGEFPSPLASVDPAQLMLIPEEYFSDRTAKPYVGPVSKDSAESSFIPDRGLIHDTIASRDLTGLKNPYGFNSGALKLCKLTNTAYGLLCAQIFNGSSGSILNQISQDVAALTGGNVHRNHEEVQAIQTGIMKIHLIPDITTIPTGTGYNISTIAGYKISGLVPVPAVPITDSMLVYSTPSVRIMRTWKSYIDYEPYTTITLRIPYVGNINIPPSIIYDNAVSLTYHLDLFSGTLSVDIIIHDYTNGNSYIFSTLQANCAVSLPIAGTAAAGAPLLKIASGLLGVAMSGVGSSANNIFSVISGLQDTKKSVPFGNFAQSNISAYFDSRHCYAIIQSVNPSNADTFLADKGYVAHLSGIINDFAGSGTEMHCRFETIDLTGLSKLTEQEKQEVESMLKSGVHIRKV